MVYTTCTGCTVQAMVCVVSIVYCDLHYVRVWYLVHCGVHYVFVVLCGDVWDQTHIRRPGTLGGSRAFFRVCCCFLFRAFCVSFVRHARDGRDITCACASTKRGGLTGGVSRRVVVSVVSLSLSFSLSLARGLRGRRGPPS